MADERLIGIPSIGRTFYWRHANPLRSMRSKEVCYICNKFSDLFRDNYESGRSCKNCLTTSPYEFIGYG